MSALDKIPASNKQGEINVVIEIPANSGPVKYEIDKNSGLLAVDRIMPTAMYYPCDYGFIPSTLAEDGDPADVLLLTPFTIQPGSLIQCRPIGLLRMADEKGEDSKIFALPLEKVCIQYAHIKSLSDIPKITLDTIAHFFEHYKDLEPNKWVKVVGWEGEQAAYKEVQESIERYKQQAMV